MYWISQDIQGYSWISLDILVYLGISQYIQGYPSISNFPGTYLGTFPGTLPLLDIPSHPILTCTFFLFLCYYTCLVVLEYPLASRYSPFQGNIHIQQMGRWVLVQQFFCLFQDSESIQFFKNNWDIHSHFTNILRVFRHDKPFQHSPHFCTLVELCTLAEDGALLHHGVHSDDFPISVADHLDVPG